MSQLIHSSTSLKGEIPGHVRTAIEGECSDCGNHSADLQMDRLEPRFRCPPCAQQVAAREARR